MKKAIGVKEAFAEAEADETKVFDSAIREPHVKTDVVASVTVNGRTLNWQLESGRVLGLRKYSKTDVSGGGITYQPISTTPVFTAGPVFTNVQVFTEFILRNHEGTESLYRFIGGEDIILRDGHRVMVIFGGPRRSSWIALVNHDTKKWFRMGNPIDFIYATGLVKKISGWRILALFGVGVLLFCLIGTRGGSASSISMFDVFAVGGLLLVMFGMPGVIAAKIVRRFRANSTYKNQVVPVLEDLVGKLLSSTNSMAWPS
jgi:hypothetical protein